MKYAVALLSLFGAALAGGVTEEIAPTGSYPSGCSKAYSGEFEVTVAVVKEAKRDLEQPVKRNSCGADGVLLLTLNNGVLTDSKGRTGYIASNYQFQFDGPPQAGAIYTAGFSVCGNNSLALGGSTTWWQCKSGDFYNLYDRNWAAQCEAVQIMAMSCDGASNAAESADGQIVATEVITTTIVRPISDGQPQVITTTIPVPICQIGDGQIQGHTTPCASIKVSIPSAVPVSQHSDGQIEVTTPASTMPAVTATTTAPATTAPATTAPATTAPTTTAPTSVAKTIEMVKSSSTTTPASPAPTTVTTSSALRVAVDSFVALVMGIAGTLLVL